ncbi:unnamed protein product [Bursaphelenchus okinawaensis]|uniref:Uncharacterized protein n=1 Tax=Bursaphelenchus okinawaensis TaxID=465554 RepID=A0A811KRL5_9BILA|nr:unnamed protein product [Bursaphelenchus okinawaensis]CAG9112362.1 unnamed protein product [Bursaphelenchus okinawaensis]
MAAPIPHRTASTQKNVGAFPPPVYYRDTLGLQPVNDRPFSESITTLDSDNTETSKSTVRTTMNIYHPIYHNNHRMLESQYTDPSTYHVEQIITNRVLILHARTLLIIILCAFGAAIQLLMFSVICILFDGSPYYVAFLASILFILNSCLLFYFLRKHHSRALLIFCCFTTSIVFIICVFLFFWTAYLIYDEDQKIRKDGFDFSQADLQTTNHIVVNTRIAMYSLHMIFTPIQAVCCAAILFILLKTLGSLQDGKVLKGYFFSKPIGHQTVLVPIEVKQVRNLDLYDDNTDNNSIGVQTTKDVAIEN